MKRSLPFLLLPLLTACSYGSLFEAKAACDKWVEEGPSEEKLQTRIGQCKEYFPEYLFEGICKEYKEEKYTYTEYSNSCQSEEKTNQILGMREGRVVKRFRY